MNTDEDWEQWGRRDPYFGVITHERFRRDRLDDAAREAFFESGRDHVRYVLAMCRNYLDPHFAPARALDFGCGVGRVTLPLAAECGSVLGLDVSPSMIAEAGRNAQAQGVANVELLCSGGDDLSAWAEGFDLVHSCIVLQHIEPTRARALFGQLLGCLRPGGLGALQLTYAKAWFPDSFGRDPNPVPTPSDPPPPTRLLGLLPSRARQPAPDPLADPGMQMFSHDLNALFFLMQTRGVRRCHAEFTDHGGEYGVSLFFQKP